MLVRDWMTHPVVTVSPQTSVLNARRLLQLHGFRHLPVVDADRVVGMVSDHDIQVRDIALTRTLASLESDLLTGRYRRIETVMSHPVHVAAPDQTIQAAAAFMVARGIGALPVVDRDRLVGIIGLTDCVRAMVGELGTAAAASPCAADAITDVDGMVPLGPGDTRPGRSRSKPVALVIDSDPGARLRSRNDLVAVGYDVRTCPGPLAGTLCPAMGGAGAPRCPRVPANASLVVIDADTAQTPLPEAYEQWLPAATLRLGNDHHPAPAHP